jgi:uncharacterized membrane protein (UPF0127 family)
MPSFLSPLLRDPASSFCLRNARSRAIVATRVLTAVDSASRRTGLLGQAAMPDGCALVIAPTNAIHTFFMRFTIDVAFVTRDGRVVKIRPALRPWRLTGALRAWAVIEVGSGALARSGTARGDHLEVVPAPD